MKINHIQNTYDAFLAMAKTLRQEALIATTKAEQYENAAWTLESAMIKQKVEDEKSSS